LKRLPLRNPGMCFTSCPSPEPTTMKLGHILMCHTTDCSWPIACSQPWARSAGPFPSELAHFRSIRCSDGISTPSRFRVETSELQEQVQVSPSRARGFPSRVLSSIRPALLSPVSGVRRLRDL
jgi:hypothetical protein